MATPTIPKKIAKNRRNITTCAKVFNDLSREFKSLFSEGIALIDLKGFKMRRVLKNLSLGRL
jgi:hypothetical protein